MGSVKTLYRLLFLSGLLILANCSVEKNTASTRFYHSMTARYNIYFNGYESYKSGLQKIEKGYHDDFGEILRVFEDSDPATVSLCSPDMETAIQKASKLITLKSITARPDIKKGQPDDSDRELLNRKEYNEWVDDSYFLIGRARFHKHEFTDAASLFTYCIANANDAEIVKEASIWLARVNNETGNYTASLQLLNDLEPEGFSKKLQALYYSTFADVYVRQKRYEEAMEPLQKAADLVSGKKNRYRLTYLLAQLNEQAGNGARATALYRKVVGMNPPYEVEFNARINIAGVFDVNSGDPVELRKELERMLRDSKNKEFQDQIYYALGNMSMKEGRQEEAIDYFRKSANSSSLNSRQKGRSYMALADYFFTKKDYMNAGMYYDSTIYFIDQKHPRYNELNRKAQDLNALISQLTIIQREDSLQKVAAMSETERNSLIATIISTAATLEAEQTSSSDYNDRYNLGQYYENERRVQGNIEQEGKWYFYNQAALTFGRTEFRRRWGNRKLEDNWRRSNKARVNVSQFAENGEESTQNAKDTTAAMNDRTKPEYYLRNLPLNDSLLAISDQKIADALLEAGRTFAERMADTAMATETLDNLLDRYPETMLAPEALYNLYNLNKDKNSIRAEAYRQRLLEKYPGSEFGRILSDPGYYEKKMADLKLAGTIYEQAYNSYTSGQYYDAISLSDDALARFPQNQLAPKFLLLRAYAYAGVTDERKFRDELNTVIKTWPGTEESRKAEELIAYLDQKVPELKVEAEKEIAGELFAADTTGKQFFTLIINDAASNINQLTFDVISYNIDNYTNKNLRTEGTLVDNRYIMINVSGFRSFSEAYDYFRKFDIKSLRNPGNAEIMSFVISDANLETLAKDMNPGRYLLFFRENFPETSVK